MSPPTYTVRIYSRPCNREQTGELPHPLLTITSVSSQGDLVLVAGYHESLKWASGSLIPPLVIQFAGDPCGWDTMESNYVFHLWDSDHHKKGLCVSRVIRQGCGLICSVLY